MAVKFLHRLSLMIDEEGFVELMQELLDDKSLKIDENYYELCLYSENSGDCYCEGKIIDAVGEYLDEKIIDVYRDYCAGKIYFLTNHE